MSAPAFGEPAPRAATRRDTAITWFLRLAGVLLLLTGAAKIYSAVYGEEKILVSPDPIAGIPLGRLMLCAGLAEVLVALLCGFPKAKRYSLRFVAALGTGFLLYRFLLWYAHSPRPCPCLGNLTDPLGLSLATADALMKAVLAYLLVGSYAAIAVLARRDRNHAEPK